MDLDSKAYSKLIHAHNSVGGFEEYIRITVAILPLAERHDHEIPEIRNEILQTIDRREFQIWQYKQYILQEEAKINRFQLEFSSQSTSHSEKDKLASVSYDYDTRSVSYEAYLSAKATIAENTMPSASNFEPAYISPAKQKIIPLTSYQSSNCKSDTGEIFISSRYAKQPKGTVLRLKDGTLITIV
ncbi:unnamed protein product [Rhizophagus irregularis]|nr:unnamed protein product [Rhizophagus irregularis]